MCNLYIYAYTCHMLLCIELSVMSRHVLLFGVNINVQSLFIQVYFRAALIPNFTDTSSTKCISTDTDNMCTII